MSTNGNGHSGPDEEDVQRVSLSWPDAESRISKITDPDVALAMQEGLERQRAILGEVHRFGGELSEAMGRIAGELGTLSKSMNHLTDVVEGMAARVARIDNEGEVTRDSLVAIRDEA